MAESTWWRQTCRHPDPFPLLCPPTGSLGGTGSRPREWGIPGGWQSWDRSPPEATDLWWGNWASQGRLRGSAPGGPGLGTAWTIAGPAGSLQPAWRPRPGPAPAAGCGPGGRPRPGEPGGRQPHRWPDVACWWRCGALPGGSALPAGSHTGAPPGVSPRFCLWPPPLPASAAASGPAGTRGGGGFRGRLLSHTCPLKAPPGLSASPLHGRALDLPPAHVWCRELEPSWRRTPGTPEPILADSREPHSQMHENPARQGRGPRPQALPTPASPSFLPPPANPLLAAAHVLWYKAGRCHPQTRGG